MANKATKQKGTKVKLLKDYQPEFANLKTKGTVLTVTRAAARQLIQDGIAEGVNIVVKPEKTK